MAVQSKASVTNSPNSSDYTNHNGTLKIKPFEFKNINHTSTTSHPIVLIGKKPTGKSWIIKEYLYNNNLINSNLIFNQTNNEFTIEKLLNLIKTKFHL